MGDKFIKHTNRRAEKRPAVESNNKQITKPKVMSLDDVKICCNRAKSYELAYTISFT